MRLSLKLGALCAAAAIIPLLIVSFLLRSQGSAESRRRSLEQLLLRQYHDRLCENGVSNYSWEQLWYDYRLCVIRKLFHPPWQWASGIHPNIWWNHLERVMSAYDDLNCRELLET